MGRNNHFCKTKEYNNSYHHDAKNDEENIVLNTKDSHNQKNKIADLFHNLEDTKYDENIKEYADIVFDFDISLDNEKNNEKFLYADDNVGDTNQEGAYLNIIKIDCACLLQENIHNDNCRNTSNKKRKI